MFQDAVVLYGLSPLARGTQLLAQYLEEEHRFIPAGAGNTIICLVARSVDAVYPRWRGEHTSVTVLAAPATGLSPLARGTRKKHGAALVLRWFIPAGAGNTSGYFIEFINITVYPRWRGEPARLFPRYQRERFIPAGAGNTKDILLFYNSFLSTQQFTNFITTISHY